MPTYDYECSRCGKYEKYQSIKAAPLKRCPTCGGRVRRLIGGGAGVLFKGSGFYETDYRSEGYKKSAQAEKTAAAPKTETPAPQAAAAAPKAEPAGAEKKKTTESNKAKKS
ncbi:MAG: zinc ribbon domain-containing protein [Kiritimatiellaeota bacterium]|nr:zinc ribbon domain-containing protein [Kiritimatiellota bacterium]